MVAQERFRRLDAPELLAVLAAGEKFVVGQLAAEANRKAVRLMNAFTHHLTKPLFPQSGWVNLCVRQNEYLGHRCLTLQLRPGAPAPLDHLSHLSRGRRDPLAALACPYAR
jgi:hypothetical protein